MSYPVIEDSYPLAPMQQGMLINSLYARQSSVDIEQIVCKLHEPIDREAFEKSWQWVVRRHAALRTAFHWEGLPEPMQDVYRDVDVSLHQIDLCHKTPQQKEEELEIFLSSDRKRGFSLTVVPLMRLTLLLLEQDYCVCVWTFHHVLLDGRSFNIVLNEVFDHYEASCKGEGVEIEAPRPFSDHINHLQQLDSSKMKEYWTKELVGYKEPAVLPDLWEVRTNNEPSGLHLETGIRLPVKTTSLLGQIARKHNITLNTFVQGAWAILLSRYSRMEDVVFGATRACRYSSVPGAENIVGCFINSLPVRAQVKEDEPLLPFLQKLRAGWVEMRPYEQAPLSSIQQWSEVPKGGQLFETLLVFENYLLNSSLRSQGGKWQKREFNVLEQTNLPLTVAAYVDNGLAIQLEYDPSYFDGTVIEKMADHVRELLECMARFTDGNIGQLRMTTRAEEEELLSLLGRDKLKRPPDHCFHNLFETRVRQAPSAPAIEYGGNVLSYHELNQRANQVAHYLKKSGVGPDTIVAICMDRSLEMGVGLLGILKAGGAYLPLDPLYPEERLEYMLEDSRAKIVLIREHLRAIIPGRVEQVISLDHQWPTLSQEPVVNPNIVMRPDHLAYVIYTSGTTGKPKGVMISHLQLVSHNDAVIQLFNLQPSDRVLQFASISFDIAVEELFPTWICGASVILRTEEMASSIASFLKGCEIGKVTVLNLPTAFWHELVRGLSETKEVFPEDVRLVVVGGEKASARAYENWKGLVAGRNVRWLNAYGPTETTVTASWYDPEGSGWKGHFQKELPIGKPLDNALFYVLDNQLQLLPIGVPGELHIGGFGVGRGYLHRKSLTEEKFIPDPFTTEINGKMYKTGDLVRCVPGGDLEFLGRTDYQVKIRGFRIELGEIEAALLDYPAVHESVVLAREDKPGEKRLIAYILSGLDEPFDITALKGFLRKRLPAYMTPVAFVVLKSFPKTPGGKIDRHALPPPDYDESVERKSEFVAPQLPVEVELVDMWEKLLDIRPISTMDNFFELGGDSLMAVRLFTQIEKEFGRTLPLATLLRSPTVEKLGLIIRQGGLSAPWSSLVEIQPQGTKPPLFCMHGIGGDVLIYWELAHRLGSEQPVYGLQMQGLYEHQKPHETVEKCAAHYIEELKNVQPTGPYYLCGYSSGGIMAFEMAQQLIAAGEKVGLLSMVDSYPSEQTPSWIKLVSPAYLWGFLKNIPYWVQDVSRRPPEKIITDIRRKFTIFLKKIFLPIHGSVDATSIVDLADVMDGNVEGLSDQRHYAMRVHYRALLNYQPKHYCETIVMFRSRRQPLLGYHDERLGWNKLVDRMQVSHINGPHFQIMAPPYVDELARVYREQLDKAQNRMLK